MSATAKKDWAVIQPLFRSLCVVTDAGRDQDDEDVLVMLNRYIRMGILDMLGAVANMAPADMRARLTKGTLTALGQGNIPVGVGTGALQKESDGMSYEFAVGYLAERREVEDGRELLDRILLEAKPNSVVLLLISAHTDAANVLAEDPELFKKKIRRVVIMGGVEAKDNLPLLDSRNFLIPDKSNNHTFDMKSTEYLYATLQTMGIPITVVSRHAAAAAKVPRSIYDDMAATGHPVGIRLRDAQRQAIEHLWTRACAPAGSPERKGLPDDRNTAWFCKAFLGGQGEGRTGKDSIWDLVQTFMLYDPMTLIAAVPNLRNLFFSPYVHENKGTENLIIGLDAERHGVLDGPKLASYMHSIMVASLMSAMESVQRTGTDG